MAPTPAWSHPPPRDMSPGEELRNPGAHSLKGRDYTSEGRMEKGEVLAEIRLRHLMKANKSLCPDPCLGLRRGQVRDPGLKASLEDVCCVMLSIRGSVIIMGVSSPLKNPAGSAEGDTLKRFVREKDLPLQMEPDHPAKEEKDL